MIDFVALPLLVTLAVVLIGSPGFGRLRPAGVVRCNALLIGAVGVAAVPTLWLIGLSGLAHAGFVNPISDWSGHLLPNHRPFGAVVGVASLTLALLGTIRAGLVLVRHRRFRTAGTATAAVEYIGTDEVYAYTLPGPARTIAVSDGLRRALADDELDFVIAHERAHARHRHDRYKLLGLLTSAFVPPMATVVARLEFHLERWADEEALDDTGTERQVAARTIAKVALAGASPPPALGIADHGMAARVTALLDPLDRSDATSRAFSFAVIAVTLALASYQLHHTVMFGIELAP